MEKFLDSLHREDGSTASSESFKKTESNGTGKIRSSAEQETNPTSAPSEGIEPKTPDSDKAEYGSGSDHSSPTASTPGSDDSNDDFPTPSTAVRVGSVGSHLDDIRAVHADEEFYHPVDDDEARSIDKKTRPKKAAMEAIEAAFANGSKVQSEESESSYQISVQPRGEETDRIQS